MKPFSFITKLYLILTYCTGSTIFVSHMGRVSLENPLLLLVLCVIASLTLILKVEGSMNRSYYTFNFLVYGFTFAVFGTSEAILVIVVSNIVEWIWNKPPWFIQLFNASSYLVVMQVASFVYEWINPAHFSDTWQTALALMFSMGTFNVLNHLMVGLVIWFARGETFKKSGVFDFFHLMLDLSLLYFGASLSIVWNHNALALGLFLVPLYLIYSSLRVPALERKTEIDSKTGLFNHEYFRNQLQNELPRANRFNRPLCIILADLDLLRNINNTYGHLAGDEVLIGVAKVLRAAVRDYDVVCRFGGEEFAILLPETTLAQAYERAELIRKTVGDMEFTVPMSVTFIRATMSFGIALRENFSQTPDEIIHNADLALYHSKLSGRNRTHAYSNDMYVDFSAHPSNLHADSELSQEDPQPAVQRSELTGAGRATAARETDESSPRTEATEGSATGHGCVTARDVRR